MPLCELHGIFYRPYQMCCKCGVKAYNEAKQKNKEEKAKQPKKLLAVSQKTGKQIKGKTRKQLKDELQALWSKKFKAWAKSNNLYFDWITGSKKEGKGLYSFHVSHYFCKSIYWMLWTNPANSGILSYDENVNKPQNIAAMRPMLIKVHGLEAIESLEKLQQECDYKIKIGVYKSQPPIDWLLANIQELKNELK